MSNSNETCIASADPKSTIDYLCEKLHRLFIRGIGQYRLQHPEEIPRERLDPSRRIPSWDGGKDVWGQQWQPVWPQLLQLIIENRLDAALLVHAQCMAAPAGCLPSPMEQSEKVIEHYREWATNAVEDLQAELEREYRNIRFEVLIYQDVPGITEEQLMKRAICNTVSVEASPLLRFCVAKQCKFEILAAHFEREALCRYAFQIENYEQAWGPIIPATLRDLTAGVLQELRRKV